MPGFSGFYSENMPMTNTEESSLLYAEYNFKDFGVLRKTVPKFLNDKVFLETDQTFFLIEGVIFNSVELNQKYNSESFQKTVIHMYNSRGEEFFKEFRGSFSGLIFDKIKEELLVFTDHIGSKQIFYSLSSKGLLFSSTLNDIIATLKKGMIPYSLNISSAYALLSMGFFTGKHTILNEVEKLIPGHYLKYDGKNLSLHQYYKLNNKPDMNICEHDAIEKLDALFCQALRRAFEKDKEYGYKHLVALSGGMDSRITTWVAHTLGYSENIINMTFSQSNYLDETIPKKIASDLQHEWIFKSLDNGLYLKNIEETVYNSFGGSLYSGNAHAKSMMDILDFQNFGIVHSGQLGDVIVGTQCKSLSPSSFFSKESIAYSPHLLQKIPDSYFSFNYRNEELFKFYTRYFTGTNQGLLPLQRKSETYSPFYDVDVLNFCLTLPVEMRFSHNLYRKWIMKKYPAAADYIWEKTGYKFCEPIVKIMNKNLILKRLPMMLLQKIFKKMGIQLRHSLQSKKHMNPFDYWYRTNIKLRDFMNDYYNKNIDLLSGNSELKKDCESLWKNYGTVEKTQVLTILGIMKVYFD